MISLLKCLIDQIGTVFVRDERYGFHSIERIETITCGHVQVGPLALRISYLFKLTDCIIEELLLILNIINFVYFYYNILIIFMIFICFSLILLKYFLIVMIPMFCP